MIVCVLNGITGRHLAMLVVERTVYVRGLQQQLKRQLGISKKEQRLRISTAPYCCLLLIYQRLRHMRCPHTQSSIVFKLWNATSIAAVVRWLSRRQLLRRCGPKRPLESGAPRRLYIVPSLRPSVPAPLRQASPQHTLGDMLPTRSPSPEPKRSWTEIAVSQPPQRVQALKAVLRRIHGAL